MAINVFLHPPLLSVEHETDDDSSDEVCNDPNCLSWRQLETPAEIVIHTTQVEDIISFNIFQPVETSDKLCEMDKPHSFSKEWGLLQNKTKRKER